MRIGLVVPHMFMHRDILPQVIFSPGELALQLASGLERLGAAVTLFSPGPAGTAVPNVSADLSTFEAELAARGDTYIDLLKKHPLTFVSLARQVQAEVIAKAFAMANNNELDLVHIYTNEEDIALPFAQFCKKPVIFTHHDPFSFLVKYRAVFPKYKQLNWISMSLAQRGDMPKDTNWVGNVYHGLAADSFSPAKEPSDDYIAYLGRIIEPKGVHLAIAAITRYNASHPAKKLCLRIAGKHYAGHSKDTYWQEKILPYIDTKTVIYDGFIHDVAEKNTFLANASALVVPSTFEEPFGMVLIEALASGTPVVGLDSGAIGEVIEDGRTGFVVPKSKDEAVIVSGLATALEHIPRINRADCRAAFEATFTLEHMSQGHFDIYKRLTTQ